MKKRIAAVLVVVCLLAGTWLAVGWSRTDFTGQKRLYYSQDVAFDFCRDLEEQIGVQIFYLPEWTAAADGLLRYDDFAGLEFDEAYFAAALAELEKMQAAYGRYPEGFLRELTSKRDGRRVEIVLCPYTYAGYGQYGYYQQDFSGAEQPVDHLYLTGCGDTQFYNHEIGHLVVVSGATLSGWRKFCDAWDACGESGVSEYARSSRPEDWAETWAFLWRPELEQLCEDEVVLAKVRLLTDTLTANYETFAAAELPWAELLD